MERRGRLSGDESEAAVGVQARGRGGRRRTRTVMERGGFREADWRLRWACGRVEGGGRRGW